MSASAPRWSPAPPDCGYQRPGDAPVADRFLPGPMLPESLRASVRASRRPSVSNLSGERQPPTVPALASACRVRRRGCGHRQCAAWVFRHRRVRDRVLVADDLAVARSHRSITRRSRSSPCRTIFFPLVVGGSSPTSRAGLTYALWCGASHRTRGGNGLGGPSIQSILDAS
jgi:hypothetical protein